MTLIRGTGYGGVDSSRLIYSNLTSGIDATSSMNTDGSASPVTFSFTPLSPCVVGRINISIIDTPIMPDRFGAIVGGLTNGLELVVNCHLGVTLQTFGDVRIKKNADWAAFCGSDINSGIGEGTPSSMFARWTFTKAAEHAMYLDEGDAFNVVVHDDLSSISQFSMMIQGAY